MGIKVSKDFHNYEFVPPDVYYQFGDNSIWFIDKRIIRICQWLRDYTGNSIIINDWYWGGGYQESGFRSINTSTGASLSQHKFGRAVDIKVDDMDPEEVRNIIRNNYVKLKRIGLSTIEKNTPTWIHLDIRWSNKSELFEV